MSAERHEISQDRRVVKSRGKAEDLSTRSIDNAHNTAFGELHDLIEKEFGVPGDQLPYWDPVLKAQTQEGTLKVGPFHAPEPIDLRKSLYDFWKPVYDEINQRTWEGANLQYAAEKAIEKSIQRSSFSIPIFFTPDVYRTSQEQTPLADMIARTAVDMDTIKVDEQTDLGAASSFSEGATSWPSNDDSYTGHTYDVFSYGRQNSVTDHVQLAAGSLRSTQAITEEAQVASIRQYEEAQLFLGKDSTDSPLPSGDSNDGTGFQGLPDIAPDTNQYSDEGGASMTIQKVRDANAYLRRVAKANRDDIVHFTDHTTFTDLQNDLTDFTRYDTPGDELDFGFNAIVIDNTPVFETHGLPDTDGNRKFYSVDMASIYMGMLQDVTMHPLARDAPEETFATDAYGTLVGRSTEGVHIYDDLN